MTGAGADVHRDDDLRVGGCHAGVNIGLGRSAEDRSLQRMWRNWPMYVLEMATSVMSVVFGKV